MNEPKVSTLVFRIADIPSHSFSPRWTCWIFSFFDMKNKFNKFKISFSVVGFLGPGKSANLISILFKFKVVGMNKFSRKISDLRLRETDQ